LPNLIFKKMPLVMAELERIPMDKRVGPLIVNEYTGLPYTDDVYREHWREAADDAGVPKSIQNRDSRAGGITEATDAEAGLGLVRHSSTHKNPRMTARYSNNTLAKTSRVADMRVAARKKLPAANGPLTRCWNATASGTHDYFVRSRPCVNLTGSVTSMTLEDCRF
jgi:hypothetical protein